MRAFCRVSRILSGVTLFFFCWSYLPSWDMVAYAAKKTSPKANTQAGTTQPTRSNTSTPGQVSAPGPVGTAGDKFEKALDVIREKVAEIGEETVRGGDPSAAIETLKAQQAEIEAIDIEFSKELSITERKLKKAGLPQEILDRHSSFVRHYESNLTELKTNLDGIVKAKKVPGLKLEAEKAKRHLDGIKPEKRQRAIDPASLPHKTVKGKEREPRLNKEDFEKEFGPQRTKKIHDARYTTHDKTNHASGVSHPASVRNPLLLAFNDIASDVPFQLPRPSTRGSHPISSASFAANGFNPPLAFTSSLLTPDAPRLLLAQAALDLPTAADLAETPEVQFTPGIRAKAQELGNDPLKIYEWVRNNVEFVPTYGSIQGADMCRKTRECNAFDTSSLLIALLRASNISARYVYGTIEIPSDKFMNWAGGFTDIQSAVRFVASAGMPVKPLTSGGVITKVQLEYPWVEAWIDYNPSRGARHREGDTWIPLDASYKQHSDIPGINIPGAVSLDSQAFLQALQTGSTADESISSVSGGTCSATSQLMENYRILAGNYLTQQHPAATVGDVMGSKELVKQEFPYLLGTLPYRVYTAGVRASEMPDSLRHKVTLSLTNNSGTSFTITKGLPELSGRKITLGYVPATQADRDVILNYLPLQTGMAFDLASLPADLPAYLISVKPELRIDGVVVTTGTPSGLGKIDTLTTSFTGPDQNADFVARNITAGDFIAIDFGGGNASLDQLNAIQAKLADTRTKLLSASSGLTREEVLSDLLHAAALAFSAEQGIKRRIHGLTFGVKSATISSGLLVSSRLNTTWIFGLPQKVNAGGISLDTVNDDLVAASLSGDSGKEKQAALAAGMDGSRLAARVPDDLFGTTSSLGAVRAFQAARDAGIPVHTVNQTNISTVLPLLQLDADTLADIQNAVNSGHIAVAPRSPVSLSGKTMTPLVLIDPATGGSAYFLDRDVNGSLTYPSWSTLTPVMDLAWDSLIPDLGNLSQSSLSDSFMTAFQAVQTGASDLATGVPTAHISLLTEGLFYATASSELGCYLTSPPASPAGPCMATYLGSLCIAGSATTLGTGNARPVSNAGSDRSAMVGSLVTLDGSLSTDPNNDPLTYAWTVTSKPATSSAALSNTASASPSFTPDVPGTYVFQLVVNDGKSFSDPATVTITASYEEVTVPSLSGKTQQEAETLIIASHLAVGAVTQASSDTVPSGSVVSQDPAANALAIKGSSVGMILSSGPAVDKESPVLTVAFDRTPSAYAAGETAVIYIDASDNSTTVNVTLTVDGATRSVTPPSATIDTTGMAPGSVHTVEVTATDPSNNTATISLNLGIQNPANVSGPLAEITTPALDAEVSAPTQIIGTIQSAGLLEYTLSYAPKGTTTFTTFATGTTAVTNGTLGTFDPTLLKNGLYDIRLTAADTNGRRYWVETTWRVTGDMKVGNFTVTFTDLSVPVTGIPITVSRTYDSRDKQSRDFGIGWSVDIQNVKIDENRTPGDGWYQAKQGGVFGQYCVNGDSEHYVSIALPDGRTEEFDMTLTPNCQRLSPVEQTSVGFTPRPGTTSTLALKNAKLLLVAGEYLLDPDTAAAFDPAGYVLTDKDGMVYDIDQNFGVKSVTDPNGNKLTYGNDGVTHSAGTGVRFVRDNKNRIVQVIAPDGDKITYGYNSKGELSTVTDQNGSVTTYTYNRSHGLTDIKDPRGITPVKNEYDDSGRLMAHTDSYGKRIEYTHDIAGRQEVVKDRNGNITVYIYDEKGRVLRKTDPMGSTTSFTYGAYGNKLSETDPLGNTTTWIYDAKKNVLTESRVISGQTITTSHTYDSLGKVLTTTDPLGYVTTNTYDAKGNLLTITDASGYTTTNTYDAKGNLLTTKDALGNVTSYSYDSAGRRTSETSASGTSYYTYDTNGNKLSDTDRRGNTTFYAYDKNGKLLSTENASGAITRTEYDKSGNKVADINALGAITRYYYDSANRLAATEYPDGTTTKTVYDNEGNRISSIDQDGRTTRYEYNGSKQLIKTIYADGTIRQFGYDSAGRQATVTDALGNVTTKVYDALGRVIASIDPELNSTTFEYDANGNQASQTDPNGHATTFAYDENNRLVTTTLPGGQKTTVGYDALGRKTSETDAAGKTTQFGYDAQGNLTKVTDAEGGITRYEYDLNNNRTAIVDARNNRTTFAFDSLNRLISKTMPNGGIETYTYDSAGRQIAKTDAKSQMIQYGYDNIGRLRTRSYPDGSKVRFNYTNTGKRLNVTDKRGTTSYAYDSMNRLTTNTYPDGNAINYGYDATGKLQALSSSLTGTVTYSYYNNGRLREVIDPQGRMTRYTYDAAGSRTGLAYPNGTTVFYVYDVNNRLTNLAHKNSLSEVIASYAYTLGAIGNRTRIDEANGISRQYQYDRLYRLTQEKVIDPSNTQTYQNDFAYDAVGNRLNKTNTAFNQPVASNDYTYNVADQLVTESGITYTYDLNGNLASKANASRTTTYTYDYDGRLISVNTAQGAAAYKYDADGNRVEAVTSTGPVLYLVDTNRALAQVLAEYASSGAMVASYVYADDLISMNRSGAASYYHFDGLGSTRLLTDATGTITDTYDYDAFGNQIARTGTTANDFLFTGQQYDANVGFYYLRARYYQPDTGRFTALDPYQGDPYAPASLHKYLYAANDPVNKIDPSGEFADTLSGNLLAMGMLVTLATMALIHLSKADIEIPIRLNHYTTKANLGSIMMSGFISSPSGKNYFTSDWYCDGAEAQSKLAMRNKPDVFINLMLGIRKDTLMGPSIVQPATYGNLILPGGGTEYYSTNTIFIWTRFPVVFPLF